MESSNNLGEIIDDLFNPRSIAIAGASESSFSYGFHYMNFIYKSGFNGKVYPIHPSSNEIMGLKVYADILDIPDDIDYVVSCLNASLVLDLIQKCKQKNVKVIQLFTARFSETGNAEATKLEQEIANEAKRLGIRLIGPNCMGLYNPEKKIIFNYDLPLESGSVGLISQSGGTGGEIVRFSALKGIRFSKGISYGNAIDLNECDYLEYFLWDKDTKIIILYIEGIRDGKRFVDVLKKVTPKKPVIVLKGGRSNAGERQVASHTASMAGSMDVFDSALQQSGAIQVSGIDELIDVTQAFYYLPKINGKKIGVIGGGGGKSVLSADECEEEGLDVIPMPDRVNKYLEEKCPDLAYWLGNPVDFSIVPGFNISPMELISFIAEDPKFDIVIGNSTEDSPLPDQLWTMWISTEADIYIDIQKRKVKPIVLVIANPGIVYEHTQNWRWETILKIKEKAVQAGIPVFSTPRRAANALNKLIDYYQRIS